MQTTCVIRLVNSARHPLSLPCCDNSSFPFCWDIDRCTYEGHILLGTGTTAACPGSTRIRRALPPRTLNTPLYSFSRYICVPVNKKHKQLESCLRNQNIIVKLNSANTEMSKQWRVCPLNRCSNLAFKLMLCHYYH